MKWETKFLLIQSKEMTWLSRVQGCETLVLKWKAEIVDVWDSMAKIDAQILRKDGCKPVIIYRGAVIQATLKRWGFRNEPKAEMGIFMCFVQAQLE